MYYMHTIADTLRSIADSLCTLMRHEDEGTKAALGAQDCLDGLLRAAACVPRESDVLTSTPTAGPWALLHANNSALLSTLLATLAMPPLAVEKARRRGGGYEELYGTVCALLCELLSPKAGGIGSSAYKESLHALLCGVSFDHDLQQEPSVADFYTGIVSTDC